MWSSQVCHHHPGACPLRGPSSKHARRRPDTGWGRLSLRRWWNTPPSTNQSPHGLRVVWPHISMQMWSDPT